ARYPLRLLGLSLSSQFPGFPVPPSGPTPATKQTEARIAAARARLDVRGLAVSARASGGFAAPFAAAGRGHGLAGWQAAMSAPGLANRYALGIKPTVTAWRPDSASLTFSVGTGFLIQLPGAGDRKRPR